MKWEASRRRLSALEAGRALLLDEMVALVGGYLLS